MYLMYYLLTVAVTTVTGYYDESSDLSFYYLEEADYHFNEFMEKFGKNHVYSEHERQYRSRIFKENLQKINELNIRSNFNLHGITQFADMTEEEFMNYANCFSIEGLNMSDVNVIELDNLSDVTFPEELDYRNHGMVTEVKDQGRCGDCYIFSAVGNIEGLYARKHRQLYSLSEQQVLDCMAPGGCDIGGFPHETMQTLAFTYGGLVTESAYPYVAQQKQCNVDTNQIVARVESGHLLNINEDLLVVALNVYGPLSIGISANPAFQSFTGGRVFNDPSCDTEELNHAVLLVGYGIAPEGPYWLIKNSWGTQWGEQGYVRLARGARRCNIGSYVATAFVA